MQLKEMFFKTFCFAINLLSSIFVFFPTVVAFDILQNYKEENIPVLKHPFRWIIFFTNLILGGTGIVWLFLYFWSFLPGKVVVEIVTFEKIEDDKKNSINPENNIKISISHEIETLDKLREKNLISEKEFDLKKKSILDKENKESNQYYSIQIQELDVLRQKGLKKNKEFKIKKNKILGI